MLNVYLSFGQEPSNLSKVLSSTNETGSEYEYLGAIEITDPDLDFEIFPNPTKGPFEINFGSINGLKGRVYVYSINGQVVFERGLESLGKLVLDPSDWESGVYLIQCLSGDLNIIKRVVISNE